MEKGTRRGRTTERRDGGGQGRRREIGDKEGRRNGKAGGEGGRWKEGREALCPEGTYIGNKITVCRCTECIRMQISTSMLHTYTVSQYRICLRGIKTDCFSEFEVCLWALFSCSSKYTYIALY